MTTIRIVPPESNPDDAGSEVTVQIRDTSCADMVHPVIVEVRASFPRDARPFFDIELDTQEVDLRRASYSVWVHCDRSGDGAIGDGDLITTQSFPVPVDGDQPIVVTLTRV